MKKRLHILQILPSLNEGGVERGTVESNREYVRRGHQSTVISVGGRLVQQIEIDGGRHIEAPVKSKNILSVPSRVFHLRRILRNLAPDIIHVRSRVPAWLTRFANAPLGIPVVSTVHGLNSVSRYSRIMTEADRVICVSHAGIDYIREAYNTPEKKIRLVHRGVDPEVFNPERLDRAFINAFREEYDLEGKFVVMAVGRITALKGYEVLIKAVAELAASWPSLRAIIVGGVQEGQGKYAESLKTLARERSISGQIIFAGSQSKIPELYTCADLVVSCNTKKPESFGRSVAEAIAMNRPVIATRHGGVLDIIRPEKNGWFVPPGDVEALANAILSARTALPHLHDLREEILTDFSLSGMVDKTLAVYRELLPG